MDLEDLEDHLEDHLEDLVDHLMSAWEAWVVLVDHWHLMLEVPMVGEWAQWVV